MEMKSLAELALDGATILSAKDIQDRLKDGSSSSVEPTDLTEGYEQQVELG